MLAILILIFISNLTIAGAIVFSKLYKPGVKAEKAPEQEQPQPTALAQAPQEQSMSLFEMSPAIAQTIQAFYGLDTSADEEHGDK